MAVSVLWHYSITFSNSSFISPVFVHALFERSTDKEAHNPSANSSDGRGDPLGTKLPGCWQLKNKKNSPSTINKSSIVRCSDYIQWHEREREKEWVRERERERERVKEKEWVRERRREKIERKREREIMSEIEKEREKRDRVREKE